MKTTRRQFIRASALTLGFLGLRRYVHAADAAPASPPTVDYGPLVKDPAGLLDLPAGFSYKRLVPTGTEMADGFLMPAAHDGQAAFAGPDGKIILLTNHEITTEGGAGAFGPGNDRLARLDPKFMYDAGSGRRPCLGGVTTQIYNPKTGEVEAAWLSLAGTMFNCAGGPMPWGAWVTCEENTTNAGGTFEKAHGFNFEVPVSSQPRHVEPVPLKAMGRFRHEAVAHDARTGVVFQSEDVADGLFYRFLPSERGKLAAGGKLQALALADERSADTRNWRDRTTPPLPRGEPLRVKWIDLEDIESPRDDLRGRGFAAGAARFARMEGVWSAPGEIYMACTNGGPEQFGQIFRYKPSPAEGTPDEARQPGTLELFLQSDRTEILQNGDSITVAPWGDLFVGEDGVRSNPRNRVMRINPKGESAIFASNPYTSSELTGACFSPDGQVLFLNVQRPGYTLAITGPWRGPARA